MQQCHELKSNINNVEYEKEIILSDMYKDAQVITSDGKNIGIIKSLDSNFLVVLRKGLVRDEEFHIPVTAVSHYDRGSRGISKDNNLSNIILNLNEEQVKHGFEFVGENKPNSDLISGKSDSAYKIGLEKETIRYEVITQDFEKNVEPASSTDKLPSKEEYICDMCMQKFNNSDKLQEHRKAHHSAPTGI